MAPLIAAIGPLIGAISAGTGLTELGLQLSGAGRPSGGNAAEQQRLADEAAAKARTQSEQQAFRRVAPDVQAVTSGSLGDEAFAQMVSELAGAPQDLSLAQQTIFGPTGTQGGGQGLSSGGGLNV